MNANHFHHILMRGTHMNFSQLEGKKGKEEGLDIPANDKLYFL